MNYGFELQQKQTITQKFIQSVEILQLNTLDLKTYLNDLSMENPVIEVLESAVEKSPDTSPKQSWINWQKSYDWQNRSYYTQDSNDENLENNLFDMKDRGEDLKDSLFLQIMDCKLTPLQNSILSYLIDSLDQNGYLSETPDDIANYLGISCREVQEMIQLLQSLEPAGIGTGSLSECLLLQLKRKKIFSPFTEMIIKDYLSDVAKQHYSIIAKHLHCSLKQVLQSCELIKSLNPRPGNCFSDHSQTKYIEPDVIVFRQDQMLNYLLNDPAHTGIRLSADYLQLFQETDDRETRAYLKEKIDQAKGIASSVELRTSTLSQVMDVLLEKQRDFFLLGPSFKEPLRLIDIAEQLELHESTISRALSNKYLECNWGLFPLNSLLTNNSALSSSMGKVSSDMVKERLKWIIDHENKSNPLSDQDLAIELKKEMIQISRRTVNKYRIQLDIPDKSGRKN